MRIQVLAAILYIIFCAAVAAVAVYLLVLIIKALRKYIGSKEVREEKRIVRKSLAEELRENRLRCKMTQEFVAETLGVSRQAVSKWENGLSVPDSDMLISISEALETPVSTLLGETVKELEADDLKAIAEKLEVINLQLAQRKTIRRKIFHWLFILLCIVIVMMFAAIAVLNSPYLYWDYSSPETAVIGVGFHAFEWLFIRVAPLVLIAAIGGIFLTRKKHK